MILGDGGSDILYGGLGNDLFDFLKLIDSTHENPDIIMDFQEGQDKLDLESLGFRSSDFGINLITEIVNGETVVHDLHSDFEIKLHGEHQLVISDFVF